MKKRICIILMMLLALQSISLCGCTKADDKDSKKKTEASEDKEKHKKKKAKDEDVDTPEFSEKIFIGASYNAIPSSESGIAPGYIYIYTDKSIVGLVNEEPVYSGTLTDEQYENISEINRKKLYNTEVKEGQGIFDGESYYLRLFGTDGQIVKELGAYEPDSKYFNSCRSIIFENLPLDEISDCFYEKIMELSEAETGIGDPEEDDESFYYVIDNWEGDYYTDGTGVNTYNDIGITLDKAVEESNEIIDGDIWLEENGFVPDNYSAPEGYYIDSNGYYLYRYNPDNIDDLPYCIGIYDEYFNYFGTLDFSQYIVPRNVVEEDRAFCEVWTRYAWIDPERNVVYVSLAHSTYANSGPETGYVVAVDLSDGHLIWRTESLTCNSDNFRVLEDTIICGYGFTAEDDYIYQIDVNTGVRYKKIKVKSSPDMFFIKDGQLYVRCYDTNYVFDISYG